MAQELGKICGFSPQESAAWRGATEIERLRGVLKAIEMATDTGALYASPGIRDVAAQALRVTDEPSAGNASSEEKERVYTQAMNKAADAQQEILSRSVQRRLAAMKGEPPPTFAPLPDDRVCQYSLQGKAGDPCPRCGDGPCVLRTAERTTA